MKGKLPPQEQRNIFRPILSEIINSKQELVVLSTRIDWKRVENEFGHLYSKTGKPGVPIRTMAGLLILKKLYNLGDIAVMEQWVQNPYFQYFCGESEFQWKFPCDPSDLGHFRKRIGPAGTDLILEMSETVPRHKIRPFNLAAEAANKQKDPTDSGNSGLVSRVTEMFKKFANR